MWLSHTTSLSDLLDRGHGRLGIIGENGADAFHLSLLRGKGYVAAKWKKIAVVGVYFANSRDLV